MTRLFLALACMLVLDRVEGGWAVILDDFGHQWVAPVENLPEGAKEGTCLTILPIGAEQVSR